MFYNIFLNSLVIYYTRYKSGFYHLLEGAGGPRAAWRSQNLCTLIFKVIKRISL